MATRNPVARKIVDADAATVTFQFFTGRDAEGKPQFDETNPVVAALDDLPGDIRTRLCLHGLAQKVGDAYAGEGSSIEAARKAAEGVISQLASGEWTDRAEPSGGQEVLDLIEAIRRVNEKAGKTIDLEAVATKVRSADPKDRRKIAKALAPVLHQIKGERLRGQKPDADVLSELGL